MSAFLGQTILAGNFYYGYATKSFTHSWTSGTSVLFQLSASETKTDADKINYYLSFNGGATYRQITNGGLVYYPSTAGATQTVILKIEFITPSISTALSVQDVSLDIISYVSLFSLASKVLNDFDDLTNILESNYEIDSGLGEISIPNAYLQPQSFRDAIELICNAGAARAYSDRTGKFIIERVNTEADVVANRDNTSYFTAQNESNPQELINRVTVKVNPLTQATSSETIAELSETAEASSVKTYTVFFDTDPSDTVTFNIPESGVSVTDSTVYTWGANVEITNANGTPTDFNLTVSGKPYTVRGSYEIRLDDSESIRRSGVQELVIDNPLIQTEEQAADITQLLIDNYKNQKRLISADIVPDPSIEIGDGIGIDGKLYNIFNQGIRYGTGLLQDITGVKQ